MTEKLPPAEACSALPYVSFARMLNSVSRPATARERPPPKAREWLERAAAGKVCIAKGEPEMCFPCSVTARLYSPDEVTAYSTVYVPLPFSETMPCTCEPPGSFSGPERDTSKSSPQTARVLPNSSRATIEKLVGVPATHERSPAPCA